MMETFTIATAHQISMAVVSGLYARNVV